MNPLFEKLLATRKLPTPSSVALEIMRLSASANVSLNDIADIVEKDPALSGKILKYANSALFAATEPVVAIRKAIVRLGTNTVVRLALGFSLLSKNRDGRCEQFNYTSFWSGSLAMAVAARGIAEIRPGFDPDELFICGLLCQIGKLALAGIYPKKYNEILSTSPSEPDLLLEEHNEFGIDHIEVSMELFRTWRIPPTYIEAVAHLEQKNLKDLAGSDGLPLIHLLQLARLMAMVCMLEIPLEEKIAATETLAEKNAIGLDEFTTVFDTIISRWQEWSLLFQIPIQECTSYSQIKSICYGGPPLKTAENQDHFCILVVDDDPLTLHSLETLLASGSTTILTANNGSKALRLATEHQPDMVITDWRMPEMSGLELCRILRKTEFAEHLYIIILTANESDDALVQAFETGADDYVLKPFTPKVLEARIRAGKRLIRYQAKMNEDRAIIQDFADRLTAVNKKFYTMAMTDALTGLPNRRCAMERLQEMMSESQRFGNPISCILIDIDNFKRINDVHGHICGDIVLQEIAKVFKKKSRTYDMICRIGGEEFLVINDRNSLQETAIFAERLRQEVAGHEIVLKEQRIRITISLGVSITTPDMSEGNSLVWLADRALYTAKKNGRNRVEIAGQPPVVR